MVVSTAYLAVFRFASVGGASVSAELVGDLVAPGRLDIDSAATVRWEPDASRPSVGHLRELANRGPIGEMFWVLLFGVVFFAPLLAAAVGAPASGLAAALHDVGIDEGFVHRVRDEVTPGTSALFVVAHGDALDTLTDAFAAAGSLSISTTISTTISAEQVQALRSVFGG